MRTGLGPAPAALQSVFHPKYVSQRRRGEIRGMEQHLFPVPGEREWLTSHPERACPCELAVVALVLCLPFVLKSQSLDRDLDLTNLSLLRSWRGEMHAGQMPDIGQMCISVALKFLSFLHATENIASLPAALLQSFLRELLFQNPAGII